VSISSLTFFPTRKPPVSTAMFQVRSQSSRSTSVLAENAARWILGLCPRTPSEELGVQDDLAGDVPDRQVADELERVAAGRTNLAAAEHQFGVVLDVEEVTAAQVVVPHVGLRLDAPGVDLDLHEGILEPVPDHDLPSNSLNRPRTLESMCRATNPIVVCALSNTQVPAGGNSTLSTTRTASDWATADLLLPPSGSFRGSYSPNGSNEPFQSVRIPGRGEPCSRWIRE
jgi:hypothetical protein